MPKIKDRYKLVPQMKYYDEISCEYKPYVMFFNRENYKSKIINTDELGFRFNYHDNNYLNAMSFTKFDEVSLIIGGSTVFGFGATADDKTISSLLSKKTGEKFINFGATAFNNKQELFLFLNHFQKFKKIKRVIIVSGINDLYISINQKKDEWGNFFFKNNYEKIHKLYKIRNKIDKKLLYYFFKIIKGSHPNPDKIKITDFFKDNFKNDTKDLNYSENLKNSFDETFDLWSKLSKIYNFKLHYFLQPHPSWMNKPLSDEEKKLFEILDNTNDFSHQILKRISEITFYKNFSKLLKDLSKLHGINYSDLNLEFYKNDYLDEWLFVDRVHMTDKGYDLSSGLILNNIQ